MTKPKPTKHTVTWTHPITGKSRGLELTHTRDYINPGNDHLEIRSIKPRDAPHPLSASGYRSHFIDADELKAQGGPVRFITDWLAREAKSKAFVAAEHKRLQGDLFAAVEPTPFRPLPAPGRHHPDRQVDPDPEYLAHQEEADGQKWTRRAAAQRGKRVKPPEPR